MQIVENFVDLSESLIGGGLGTDSGSFFACSEDNLFPDWVFLEIDWGRGSLLFSVDNELGLDCL